MQVEEDDIPKVSLRDFQKLRTLRVDWRLLWPSEEIPFEDDEKSDGGFYNEEETADANSGFDVHSVLPASLETLHLTGPFTEEEKEMVGKVREPSEYTPLLKKIYIGERSALVGDGELPNVYNNPLLKYLEGHGS